MTTFSLEHAHPTQVISHSAPQPSSLWDTTGIEHPLPKASLASGQKEKRPREAHTDPDILPLGNDTCNFHSQFMGWSESCSQGWQQQGGRKKAPSQKRQAGGATQEGAVKLVWDIATHCMLQEWIWDLFFFFNSHLFGCLRSYLQREASLLNQCDLLLWGTDSLLVLGLQGMWAQWLQRAGLVAMACGILVPQTGIEPASPALQGRFLTTGPSGKPLNLRFESRFPGIPVSDP